MLLMSLATLIFRKHQEASPQTLVLAIFGFITVVFGWILLVLGVVEVLVEAVLFLPHKIASMFWRWADTALGGDTQ